MKLSRSKKNTSGKNLLKKDSSSRYLTMKYYSHLLMMREEYGTIKPEAAT